ncbi:MAG: hypothetical protein MJE68_01835 [Proteobacteria bacterium]|nr:hypothetical protein [Pseudomonadota bacterium]
MGVILTGTDPGHQVGGGGHILNNYAQSTREIFGHAHFPEKHAHIGTVNARDVNGT